MLRNRKSASVFAMLEPGRLAVDLKRARQREEAIGPAGQFRFEQRGIGTAQKRFHPRLEFGNADRLGHEVVGAERQRLDHVLFLAPPGHEENGETAAELFANPSDDVGAFDVGKPPIEDQHVEALLVEGTLQGAAVFECMTFMSDHRHGMPNEFELARLVVERCNSHFSTP